MKNVLIVNLSPRIKGTSAVLAQMAGDHLSGRGHQTKIMNLYQNLGNPDALYEAVRSADTLVFCGPCYINTYPADTIALLQALAARGELLHGQQVYGIIQGGMPYIHTHESGLTMLRLFSARCGLRYGGGFVMGMGAMLDGQPLGKLPNAKRVSRQLHTFFDCIDRAEEAPIKLSEDAQFKLPALATGLMARWMNHRIDADLRKHGADVRQASPYS